MLTTAIVTAALWAAEPAKEQHAATIAFLQSLQTPSGGFVSVWPAKPAEPTPSLRTTRTAIRTFRLLGGEPADRSEVVRYLMACYDPRSGGFSDRPGTPPDAISTSVGLMIFGELKLPVEPYLDRGLKFLNDKTDGFEQIRMVAPALEQFHRTVPQAHAWLAAIDRARNPDGSFGSGSGKARTTALHVVAQLRLGGKPASNDAVLRVLRAGQRSDGGFGGDQAGGSDLEACYRIVRLFSRLNTLPDRPDELRAFIRACRNADGGYGVRPRMPSSLHGTYYATIVRHWLDGGK